MIEIQTDVYNLERRDGGRILVICTQFITSHSGQHQISYLVDSVLFSSLLWSVLPFMFCVALSVRVSFSRR